MNKEIIELNQKVDDLLYEREIHFDNEQKINNFYQGGLIDKDGNILIELL